ncbi:MAG: hypothetical protein NT094_03890 [Candidatus Staskawiczbacteria bacterium]|nr:hypothetical protein [Candidatus Staskawiczbacteria bacterium]
MHVRFARTLEEVRAAMSRGYEPIECAFGIDGSVMGEFKMDHHGEHSALEGVALRAYRDYFGACRENPRFVVTGAADADACFAIAALAGILPHPSREAELASAPPSIKAAGTRDLSVLAELVNRVDTAPIGVHLADSDEGVLLLFWNQLASSFQDSVAFYSGVDRWRMLLSRAPQALLAAAKAEEAYCVELASQAPMVVTDGVLFVESQVWGFDVWYEKANVVAAYVASNGNVTIGCPNVETAERLFGPGGLKLIFDRLEPKGWGGREAIGGSPRGQKLTREQALAAAGVIARAIIQ